MPAVLPCVCLAVRPAVAPPRAAAAAAKPLPKAAQTLAAAAAAVALFAAGPSVAELNRFEGETLGEFNRGTAQQFGGACRRVRARLGHDKMSCVALACLRRRGPPATLR